MCMRQENDNNNEKICKRIIANYPDILNGYMYSMSRKTSYTKVAYLRYACNFLDYLKIRTDSCIIDHNILSAIKPSVIDSYMDNIRYDDNGKENSVTYRCAQFAAIKGLFKYLKRDGVVDVNPCDDVETPRDNKEHEIVVMKQDDIDEMLLNIKNGINSYKCKESQKKWRTRDELIIILGITTGLRVSALVGINVSDINFKNGYIRVNEKGNVDKKVFIGNKTKKLLQKWLEEREVMYDNLDDAVFICNGGKRMSVRTMENIIKKISNGKFTPHKMRATCATRLYEATGDIYRVQQQLGHKSIKNTERYAKVSEKKKMESANILDSMF